MRLNWGMIAATGLATVMGSQAASAQTALDRVDPVQTDRQARDDAPPVPADAGPPPRVDVQSAPAATRPAAPDDVLVGAILFSGLDVLTPQDFADIVADSVGRRYDRAGLAALASRVADAARARGYVLANAVIEPQRMATGVLTVRVDEGRIDRIRTRGDSSVAVERALAPLADGRPVTRDRLERTLLLAGDLAGMQVYGSRYRREGQQGVLEVRVVATPMRGRLVLENDGSRPIGPEQARLDVDAASLIFAGDALEVTYIATPFEPGELNYGRVRYVGRVDRSGTELGVTASISSTEPGAYLADRDIRGRSWFVGGTLLQPLWRRRDASLWLEGEFGVRTLRQFRDDVLARHDRVVAARLGLYGFTDFAGGRVRANVVVSQGLSLFDATTIGERLASRPDAPVDFTTLTAWADYIRPMGSNISLRVAARSQFASDPLLISEETGIGGGAFLRGYNYNERSGDQAAMAMGELRWDWLKPMGGLVRRSQLYAFADGGRVTNLAGGRGSGSLASGGGGVRTQILRGLNADLEVAVPFSGERYDTGDADPRFNFRIAKTF